MNELKRFEKYIFYSPDGCWYWTSDANKKGYGRILVNGIATLAHRFSYTIHIGNIPDGLLVCHSCDNPICVNPHHLFLGTNDDNMADKVKKGRSVKGEKHGNSKLTEEIVIQIRSMHSNGVNGNAIKRLIGISRSGIQSILQHKTWKHL